MTPRQGTNSALASKPRAVRDPILTVFKSYPGRVCIFMAVMFFAQFGIYVILTWLPALIGKQGIEIARVIIFVPTA